MRRRWIPLIVFLGALIGLHVGFFVDDYIRPTPVSSQPPTPTLTRWQSPTSYVFAAELADDIEVCVERTPVMRFDKPNISDAEICPTTIGALRWEADRTLEAALVP